LDLSYIDCIPPGRLGTFPHHHEAVLLLIRSPVLPCEGVGDVATASGAVIAMGVALREVVGGAATTGAMDVAGAAKISKVKLGIYESQKKGVSLCHISSVFKKNKIINFNHFEKSIKNIYFFK